MAAGLDALGDDQVAAGVGGGAGLLHRADLPARQRTGVVSDGDQRRVGLAPVPLHQRHEGCHGIEQGPVEERHEEVHPEGLAGRGPTDRVDVGGEIIDYGGQHSQSPGARHGGGQVGGGGGPHAGQLDGHPTADQLGEGGGEGHPIGPANWVMSSSLSLGLGGGRRPAVSWQR